MAENKKGFILYADLIHTITKMAKTEDGKKQVADLFITILEYVNDKDPVPHDPVVDIVFEPIKQQLKRDLKKWEDGAEGRKERASQAGKKSAELRRTKPNGINSGQLGSSNSTESTQVNSSQPNQPVTVTVNDSVNGSEINKKLPRQFFRIKDQLYEQGPGDYFKQTKSIELEAWQMSHPGEKIVVQVLERMNKDYVGTNFNSEQHLHNTFKHVWDKVKTEAATQTNMAGYVRGQKPNGR